MLLTSWWPPWVVEAEAFLPMPIGRGTAPKWLNDLLVDGKIREHFLIRQNTAA